MFISDIFQHMKGFIKTHPYLFFTFTILIGFVMAGTQFFIDSFDRLMVSAESTYPPFMLLWSNLLLGGFLSFFKIVIVGFWMIVMFSAVASINTKEFWPTVVRQSKVIWRHFKTIYKFCLWAAVIESIGAGLCHIIFKHPVSSYFQNSDSHGLLTLISMMGYRLIEALTIFTALFCFSREGSQPVLGYFKFMHYAYVKAKTDICYRGCKYYALLFGCVDYVSGYYHGLSLAFYPLCVAYICSMFLLANGLSFVEPVDAETV